MSPDTLFERHIKNDPYLGARYRDTRDIPLEARAILYELFGVAARSSVRGVYRPDIERDGEIPLPSHVARAISALDGEEVITRSLPLMVKYNFCKITPDGCIVFESLCKTDRSRGSGNGRGATAGSRDGAAKGGRPPKGETADSIYVKREREQRQQRSFMLPITGGGDEAEAIPLDQIAARLRAPLRAVANGSAVPVWETEKTDPETERETEQKTASVSGAVSGSVSGVSAASRPEEEEEVRFSTESKENPIPPPPPPGARDAHEANPETENRPKLETENAKPETERRKLKTEKPPSTRMAASEISVVAIELAELAAKLWDWLPDARKHAPRIFQEELNKGRSAERIESLIRSGKASRGAGFYREHMDKEDRERPAPPRQPSIDARTVVPPPSPGPEWDEKWTRVHKRLQQAFPPSDYGLWLKQLALIAFADGEATVWLPSRFSHDYVRAEFGHRLPGIVSAVLPEITMLVYTHPGVWPLAQAS